jgi:hypothetical protein
MLAFLSFHERRAIQEVKILTSDPLLPAHCLQCAAMLLFSIVASLVAKIVAHWG